MENFLINPPTENMYHSFTNYVQRINIQSIALERTWQQTQKVWLRLLEYWLVAAHTGMEDASTEMDGLLIATKGKRIISRSVLRCVQLLDNCKFAISDRTICWIVFSIEYRVSNFRLRHKWGSLFTIIIHLSTKHKGLKSFEPKGNGGGTHLDQRKLG
jgi:hypothetical protein